tara:strand:- start:1083 stop:1958 length:876 start_codon:yes stop_codon:yes gene_type:complete
MKKDQIIILKDRGLISISGEDCQEFLQNIITNDIRKANINGSIYSAILTPQGKYLYEFFLTKSSGSYLLDCEMEITEELIRHLNKYKLQSNIVIKDLSEKFVVGIISSEKFKEISIKENSEYQTVLFRSSFCFLDPRTKVLGARLLSPVEKIYLTIKKLSLKIIDEDVYHKLAFKNGVPVKGLKNLKDKLFGLEANFEDFSAIDFKKGCYVGQENTARMKLKNKLRRKLMPIFSKGKLNIGDNLMFKDIVVGSVLINDPYPFGLIKLFDPELSDFKNEILNINGNDVKLSN